MAEEPADRGDRFAFVAQQPYLADDAAISFLDAGHCATPTPKMTTMLAAPLPEVA